MLTSAGSLSWATYLGGTDDDRGLAVSVKTPGQVFLTGSTRSTVFAGRTDFKGGSVDAFLAKIAYPAGPATRIWDGGGTNDNWSTAANWVGDIAPTAGENLVFPLNAARQNNFNNYSTEIIFGSITFSGGEYQIRNQALIANTVKVKEGVQLTAQSIVCDSLIIGGNPESPIVQPQTAPASESPAEPIATQKILELLAIQNNETSSEPTAKQEFEPATARQEQCPTAPTQSPLALPSIFFPLEEIADSSATVKQFIPTITKFHSIHRVAIQSMAAEPPRSPAADLHLDWLDRKTTKKPEKVLPNSRYILFASVGNSELEQ
jgi:hypothetical protein